MRLTYVPREQVVQLRARRSIPKSLYIHLALLFTGRGRGIAFICNDDQLNVPMTTNACCLLSGQLCQGLVSIVCSTISALYSTVFFQSGILSPNCVFARFRKQCRSQGSFAFHLCHLVCASVLYTVFRDSYEEILNAPHVEDSEDEKEIDMADQFESKYNFRFEEVCTEDESTALEISSNPPLLWQKKLNHVYQWRESARRNQELNVHVSVKGLKWIP